MKPCVFFILFSFLVPQYSDATEVGPAFVPTAQYEQLKSKLIDAIAVQTQLDADIVAFGKKVWQQNQKIVAQGGGPSDLQPLPDGFLDALDRVEMRNDKCLGGWEGQSGSVRNSYKAIKNKLIQEIDAACEAPVADEVCRKASEVAGEKIDETLKITTNAMSYRSSEGAIEFANNHKRRLIDKLYSVQQANIDCEKAIQEATGNKCVQTFYNAFSPELLSFFSRTCTASGAADQFAEFEMQMNEFQSSPSKIQAIFRDHIKNRDNESAIAEELGKLSEFLSQIENRQTASKGQ